jgi:hypothetical protein
MQNFFFLLGFILFFTGIIGFIAIAISIIGLLGLMHSLIAFGACVLSTIVTFMGYCLLEDNK